MRYPHKFARGRSLGEQRIMVISDPLIQWPDGLDQLGYGCSAIFQCQQQPGQEQPRVGAALAASRSQTLAKTVVCDAPGQTGKR